MFSVVLDKSDSKCVLCNNPEGKTITHFNANQDKCSYHVDCVAQEILQNKECPTCRLPVNTSSLEQFKEKEIKPLVHGDEKTFYETALEDTIELMKGEKAGQEASDFEFAKQLEREGKESTLVALENDPLANLEQQLRATTNDDERANLRYLIAELRRDKDPVPSGANSNHPVGDGLEGLSEAELNQAINAELDRNQAANQVSTPRMLINAAFGSRINQFMVATILVAILYKLYIKA